MIRILLIIIFVTQLGCASIFWQTIGGTVLGNIGAEIIKEEYNEDKDEAKKEIHGPFRP